MPMNVKPIPTLDERINDIRMRTARDRQRLHPPQRGKAVEPAAATATFPNTNAARRTNSAKRSSSGCGKRDCGHRTSRRSTAGWASTSSPTPT